MNKCINVLTASLLAFTISCGNKNDSKNRIAETKDEVSKASSEDRFISAKGGLRMRDKPNTSGAKMGTIPTGTKVDLLEETGDSVTIAGATGKWSKVKWGDRTGWVFGGFLSGIKPVNLLGKILNKTIVLGEGSQDGPPFFIKISDDKTFSAVCQESGLIRGGSRGSLLEKYDGIWTSSVKGDKTLITFLGSFRNIIFTNKAKDYSGKMNKSVLEIQEKDGKLLITMKKTQKHDSCFIVGTGEIKYKREVKDAGYFKTLMSGIHFPK